MAINDLDVISSTERFGSFIPPSNFTAYDDKGFYHLLDAVEQGSLAEISTGSDCVLKQERLLSRPGNIEARIQADMYSGGKFENRVYKLVEAFRRCGARNYFESLDEAFLRAPSAHQGCGWIYARDTFALKNLGPPPDWFFRYRFAIGPARLAFEQRLVFESPILDTYSHRDDYFKAPKRPWNATMIIPASRFPAICVERPPSWRWPVQIRRYIRSTNGPVILSVVGSYFRSGLKVVIVPYVVWA